MSALVLRRDLSLEVPKVLIGAVQPYQTLGGPALTTAFLHQPDLLPFQRTPFAHPAVAPLYFHTLLHTLAEFAETPRAVQHSAVKLQHAPMDDFWGAVGTLNCFHFSAHRPYEPKAGTAAATAAKTSSSRPDTHTHHHHHHPAMGAVELVRPSHRKESDVKLTLFDSAHQPMASMLMTGPKTVAQVAAAEAAPRDAGARTPLPALSPPTPSPSSSAGLAGDGEGVGVAAVVLGGTRVCGGLYGGLVPMEDGGGFAHRAYYCLADVAASVPTPESLPHAAAEGAETAMPPWVLHEVVGRLFGVLHRAGVLCDGAAGVQALRPPSSPSSSLASDAWQLVSHHVVQTDDAVFGEPFEVVCAPPRVYPQYHLPPWRHRLGLPHLTTGPVPCVCLRCEVRQGGRLMSTGVYFFCCWA